MSHDIVILGVFVADTAYRAARQPKMGETLLGNGFSLGPGGKGSNQAVAAAKAGGDTAFLSKLGDDAFADMAMKTWTRRVCTQSSAAMRRAIPALPIFSSRKAPATMRSSFRGGCSDHLAPPTWMRRQT